MTIVTLEDRVILKNALNGNRRGKPWRFHEVLIPSDKETSDTIAERCMKPLERRYGERLGHKMWFAVNEAMINFREHAHRYDHDKKIVVRYWCDDDRAYFAIGGQGNGFDPRTVALTKEERERKNPSTYTRGRGHIMITSLADYVEYDNEGKTMMLIFDVKKAA